MQKARATRPSLPYLCTCDKFIILVPELGPVKYQRAKHSIIFIFISTKARIVVNTFFKHFKQKYITITGGSLF